MRLLSIALFDPSLSSDECTACDNILCYYPPETDPDDQLNEIGFCIGLMRLQERFGVPMTHAPATEASDDDKPTGDVVRRRRTRCITLSRKRLTVIPVEGDKYVCVATAREVLKPNLQSISTILTSHASPTSNNGPSTATQANVAQTLDAIESRSQKSAMTARLPPSQPTTSSPFFDPAVPISHSNDEFDEHVTEIIERLVDASHRMFSMMFGSVEWNHQRICVLESDERLGLRKRPKVIRSDVDQEYMEERVEQRLTLEKLLREGFLNRLVGAFQAATSTGHCLEGSFACPEGVDVLRSDMSTHLMVSGLVAQLSNSHPGAIRDTLVVTGMQTVFSTLSVRDTTTLFFLMKFYSSARYDQRPSPTATASAASSRGRSKDCSREVDDATSALRRQNLRRSMQKGIEVEFADWDLCYAPEKMLISEARRSDFLRSSTRFHRDDAVHEDQEVSSPSPPSPALPPRTNIASESGAPSLPVSDGVEFGFPFIFLGDDDPVGVYTRDVGAYRFMILVNEKFLRMPELRVLFESSLESFLRSNPLVEQLQRFGGKTAQDSNQKKGALPLSSPLRQSMAIEAEYLFYYRSPHIAQVRSSITHRLPPCLGSLVKPLMEDDIIRMQERGVSTTASVSSSSTSWLRRTTRSVASGDVDEGSSHRRGSSFAVTSVFAEASGSRTNIDDRQAIYLLDCLRSEVLRDQKRRDPAEPVYACAQVRRDTWAFVMAYGSRDLSCVITGKSDFEAAEVAAERLARLVFFYAHRPPGL